MGEYDTAATGGDAPIFGGPPDLTVTGDSSGGEYHDPKLAEDSVLVKPPHKQSSDHRGRLEERFFNRWKLDDGAKTTWWESEEVAPIQTREVKVDDQCQQEQLFVSTQFTGKWKLVLRWRQLLAVDENLEWYYGIFTGNTEIKTVAFGTSMAGGAVNPVMIAATGETAVGAAMGASKAAAATVSAQGAAVAATAFMLTTGMMAKYGLPSHKVVNEGWAIVGKYRSSTQPTGKTQQVWVKVGDPHPCKKKRPVTGGDPGKGEVKVGMGTGVKVGIGVGAGLLALGGMQVLGGGDAPEPVPSASAAPSTAGSASAPASDASTAPPTPSRGEQELAAYRGEAFPISDPSDDWITSISGEPATLQLGQLDIVGAGARILSWTPQAAPAAHIVTAARAPEDVFACGDLEEFTVVCGGGARSDEDHWLFSMSLADGMRQGEGDAWNYTYSLVADTDGEGANNWVANPSFDWDFFQGSDRWYELNGTPQPDGTLAWELVVTDARLGAERGNTSTTARAIIEGDRVSFLVPTSEFEVDRPGWRLTSFAHAGDFDFETLGADVSIGAPDQWSLHPSDDVEVVVIEDPVRADFHPAFRFVTPARALRQHDGRVPAGNVETVGKTPTGLFALSVRRLLALAAAGAIVLPALAAAPAAPVTAEADDAVVIAVIDGGFDPYHLDWLSSEMPQHLDDDDSNDLPLDRAPDKWLPGFPERSSFASFTELRLSQPYDETDERVGLDADDAEQWEKVETSTADEQHYYWLSDTKVIGLVDFDVHDVHAGGSSHGSGTSSVAAGNVHGSCPECLVVLIDYGSSPASAEQAINWAMDQPWIDVITNSYGFSTGNRDRIYSGSDTGRQRAASERGQTILFSAGNGQANAFVAPNSTLYSSQEGPDWMITVGAVSPGGASYTGHGKPADIASVGSGYPASNCSTTVDCQGTFSGTSNSTPVVAGMYAKALLEARKALPGPSRVQLDGAVAVGAPFTCGSVRPDCELGDGVLTAVELRTRLFHGAVHTSQGYFAGVAGIGVSETPRANQEHEFLNEGHGTYFAKAHDYQQWEDEVARIVDPMLGTAATLMRPDGEVEWFKVDSWCRQQLWGEWSDGYFVSGRDTLPDTDPAWPIRSAMTDNCTPLPGQ